MRYLSILWLIIVLGFQPVSAHVGLDYPSGGETFTAGQTVTIQWHIIIAHDQKNWDLYFSSDGGNNWTGIVMDLPVSQLSYDWTVPDTQTDQGKIKIVMDNNGFNYDDVSGAFTIQSSATGIKNETNVASEFSLSPNYPNPFNASTLIHYFLPKSENVRLQIFTLDGRQVVTLTNNVQTSGEHSIRWNGKNIHGVDVSSGIYLLRISAGRHSQTQRMILLR